MKIALVLSLAIFGCVFAPQAGLADEAADKEASAPVALSVPPLDHVDYPLDRPTWIDEGRSPMDPVDGEDVFIAVSSGPAPSPEAAVEMMEVMALGAVENYVDQKLQGLSREIDAAEIGVELDWVRDELISRRYDGTVKTGDVVQYESACLLRIDKSHQQVLDRLIQNQQLQHRLAAVGILGGMCLAGLLSGSILFGWLSSRQQRPVAQ
ncbi:hypothetical protein [Aporhodopirellula aestuarii]|uniref:Transmembrane protein n=1 Tax=Aporhodopirellula aestuarii TaxID=2950107 RepID=A0ABT0U8M0_9BACT|nr:hypothetical protein [Aporhodopirellula aestuarii]MCM2373260.1 hypothetical protein [Aporhodopirellula aestuarii]